MASLQVKNVPETLHQRLREEAERLRCSLGELVLEAIQRDLARREWNQRLSSRPETELGVSASKILEEARGERHEDLS